MTDETVPADDAGSDDDTVDDTDSESDAESTDSERRHHRLTRHPTGGPRNSLQSWTDHRSPLIVARNYALIWLIRISPSLRLKNVLLRAIGVTVGEGVSWGLEATPDVFWPNLITLGDDVIVGYDATLLCHEFLQDEYRTGEVVLGDRAMIGAGAIVLPGVEIGADAQVAANSLVTEDVPAGATVAGVPAEIVGGRGASEESAESDDDE
ncbi:acyltransferase [Salinirubrum litoreum]|uniref:Acyltransferase n=1 Tax=Salinirubrum litoreum TaxID=1126234 RepID=A0ABD5RCV4_9EURY